MDGDCKSREVGRVPSVEKIVSTISSSEWRLNKYLQFSFVVEISRSRQLNTFGLIVVVKTVLECDMIEVGGRVGFGARVRVEAAYINICLRYAWSFTDGGLEVVDFSYWQECQRSVLG